MADKDNKNGSKEIVEDRQMKDIRAILERMGTSEAPAEHKFWNTQPMMHDLNNPNSSTTQNNGPIKQQTVEEIRSTPFAMPAGYQWSELDLTNEDELEEVYDLLANNYVEDDDCLFRFQYSKEFLKWALLVPGFKKCWHLGVRSSSKDSANSNKLRAFITAIPAKVAIYGQDVDLVEINFLCVHKKLRSKRLAPVLIKEITRRVNLEGLFQAVYTAGVRLPVPVGTCRYYHRTLDPKKLVEVGFSRLNSRMTMARLIKLMRLPLQPTLNMVPLTEELLPQCYELLVDYLDKFKLHVKFSIDEFAHWFMPRSNVISTYVNLVDENTVKDFISFYHLPSTVIGNPKHDTLRAAYSFYNVATTVSLTELMKEALILAKGEGQDVYNALNLMDNSDDLFNELKFGIGDGNLNYYLYNWQCMPMQHEQIGLVLL